LLVNYLEYYFLRLTAMVFRLPKNL
jgi:hypothetical protein